MLKKLTLTLLFLTLTFTLVNAQTFEFKTYGISARGVDADANDIFDVKYNGLANVGVGSKVYFVANAMDTTFAAAAFTLTAQPASSAATLSAVSDLDADSKAIALVVDVAGTYKVNFTDGDYTSTITINASNYLGLPANGLSCATCHNNAEYNYVYDKWSQTGHANTVQPYTDDPTGHFREYCLGCHTTGYDPNTANNGFDDFDFVFPAELKEGNYEELLAAYPDAMKRANVTCESCHGPGEEHVFGGAVVSDNKMVVSQSAAVCSNCHDAGTHHPTGAQFNESGIDATEFDGRGFHGGHSIGAFAAYAGGRAACAPCHSGAGYVQWIKEGRPEDALGLPAATQVLAEATNFTCVTCHDPHDATNPRQLRAKETVLGDGTPISFAEYGTGAQCIDCHRSRRQAATYAEDVKNGSSHFGAHHGPQGDMLLGKNAPDYGIDFPTSPHAIAGGNACVDCHMAGETGVDSEGNVLKFGGHTFNMNNSEGEDNVEACAPCHGEVGETFKEKKFYISGNADLDGNGVAQGLQEEVHGLLEMLAEYLPKDGNGNVSITKTADFTTAADDSLTPRTMRAGYVYFFVEEDRSFGVHNPQFTVAILKAAIEEMGGVTGIYYANDELPSDYKLEQNYPNPFNPSTTIRFSVPQAGNVKVTVYDAIGKEVDVLVNQDMSAGTFNVSWDASRFASGIYFYKLQSNDFVTVKKMVLIK